MGNQRGAGSIFFETIAVVAILAGVEHRPDDRPSGVEARRVSRYRGPDSVMPLIERVVKTVPVLPDGRRGSRLVTAFAAGWKQVAQLLGRLEKRRERLEQYIGIVRNLAFEHRAHGFRRLPDAFHQFMPLVGRIVFRMRRDGAGQAGGKGNA